MNRIQTKSVAEEAFDELSALLVDGAESIDGFSKVRFAKLARDGIQTNPVLAYQALAMLSGLEWDHDAVDHNYKTALNCTADGSVASNYASTLSSLNRFAEAACMAEKASASQPTNLSELKKAIETNWYAGRWERSLELTQTLLERSRGENRQVKEHRDEFMALVRRNNVSFETIERLYDTLYLFLRDRRIRAHGFASYIDQSPGEESIAIRIHIDRSEQEVDALEEELTPLLFNAVEEFPLGSFSIELGRRTVPHAA